MAPPECPQPRVSILVSLCPGSGDGEGGSWVMELDRWVILEGRGEPLFLGFVPCVNLVALLIPDPSWPRGLQPSRPVCPVGFSRQEYRSGLPRALSKLLWKAREPPPVSATPGKLEKTLPAPEQSSPNPETPQCPLFLIIYFLPVDSIVLSPRSHNLSRGNFSQGVCGVEVLFPLWKLASDAATGIVSTLCSLMACLFT